MMATPHGAPRRWRDRRGPRGRVGEHRGRTRRWAGRGSRLVPGDRACGAPRRPAAVPTRRARGDDRHCVHLHAGGVSIGRSWSGRAGRRLHRCVRARPSAVIARDGRGDRIDGADRVGLGAHIETIVANGIAFAVAWFIGDRMRASRTRAEEAEQTRDEATREAVRDERLRIARELHDVVAHALSVIAVQSGTGASSSTARRRRPATLRAIETTSRTALAEMRRLLTVLRDDDWTEPLGPAPGLGQLDDLVAQTVAAGPVRVDVQGERGAAAWRRCGRLPDRARGFTNARKHAHASHVDLGVRYRRDQVSLEVIDDGRGQASEHAAGTASSACASGWRSTAVTSKSVPPNGGSAAPRRCQAPVRARDHQRRRRR